MTTGRTPRTRVGALGCAVLAAVLAGTTTAAQDVTEPALKAAFIYNFVKFTEWPAAAVPATGPLMMCVLGDPAVGDALTRAVNGRVVDGRSMTVAIMAPETRQSVCHVLYMSGISSAQAVRLVAPFRDAPVLTLSDMEGFIRAGGIAEFFFEHGQLRFSVDTGSAARARLQISSKLLALARSK